LRATRAYITGFGTTGLLIASALLMLTVMSAFVAFNGFPGQGVDDPIGTLLVQHPEAQVTVPARHVSVSVLGKKRSRVGGRRAAARRAHRPIAGTGPVLNRTHASQPGQTQQPASAPQSTGSPTPATSVAPQLPSGSGTPPLPDVTLPPAQVTLPPVPAPPPQKTAPPVDTSGITGVLSGQ
jgi:hypothetical protein